MSQLTSEFRTAFHAFLDRALAGGVPDDIVAFILNLYEGTETFDAQLAGSTRFESTSSEWPVDPAFSTGEYLFAVPRLAVQDSWEEAFNLFRTLLLDYIMSGRKAARLRGAKGVAIGFVDGDLTVVDISQSISTGQDEHSTAVDAELRAVWVFNGARNHFPSGVFLTRTAAEAWITAKRLRGTLTKYPVDISVYDWAVRAGLFTPKKPKHLSADFVANFSCAGQEHVHFENDQDK
jgi:hypothetical protein